MKKYIVTLLLLVSSLFTFNANWAEEWCVEISDDETFCLELSDNTLINTKREELLLKAEILLFEKNKSVFNAYLKYQEEIRECVLTVDGCDEELTAKRDDFSKITHDNLVSLENQKFKYELIQITKEYNDYIKSVENWEVVNSSVDNVSEEELKKYEDNMLKANSYYDDSRYESAAMYYETSCSFNETFECYNWLGKANFKLWNKDKAKDSFKSAILYTTSVPDIDTVKWFIKMIDNWELFLNDDEYWDLLKEQSERIPDEKTLWIIMEKYYKKLNQWVYYFEKKDYAKAIKYYKESCDFPYDFIDFYDCNYHIWLSYIYIWKELNSLDYFHRALDFSYSNERKERINEEIESTENILSEKFKPMVNRVILQINSRIIDRSDDEKKLIYNNIIKKLKKHETDSQKLKFLISLILSEIEENLDLLKW